MVACWRKTGNKMTNTGDISLNKGIILQIQFMLTPRHTVGLGLC